MEPIYEIETKHTEETIHRYIKFQDQVNAPTRKLQSLLLALCFLALILLIPQPVIRLLCLAAAVLLLIGVLAGNKVREQVLKREDPNYRKQNKIRYLFFKDRFQMENTEEGENLSLSYKDVSGFYGDDRYWYLCMKSGELHLFAKTEVSGRETAHFHSFIQKKTGQKFHYAETSASERIRIMQQRKATLDRDKKRKREKMKES